MATTTNHYDVVVVGSDIAGLVAAALCARRGKRVLVLPHGAAEGNYRLGARNFGLDTAPVVHMTTAPIARVFHELGLLQQVKRQHHNVDETIHVVLPDCRLDILPAEVNLGSELRRQWPGEPVEEAWARHRRWTAATEEALEDILRSDNALVADGFWGRRFLARVESGLPDHTVDELEPLPPTHALRRVQSAIWPWLQHLSPLQLGKAAGLRLSGLWGAGPDDLPGGTSRLRELLLQRIELHSGEVKRDLRVAEVLTKRGRVVGVSLLGKRDRYGCDHMILATDPHRLIDGTIHCEQLPKALLATLGAIVPVAFRYVMHAEVAVRGLSPALAGMVIAVPPTEDPHGIGNTYVRIWPGSADDTRWLSITRIVGADAPLGSLREQICEDLDTRGILPFFRPFARKLHSPHDGRELEDGAGVRHPEYGASSMLALPMDALYSVGDTPSLGVGVLPHQSGLRCLYFACRLTLPGLGLEGEFAAGLVAAGLVANPAKSPFSRSPLISRA